VRHAVRIATMGPGALLGEMALLEGGAGLRSADIVADERTICYGFSIEELRALTGAHPAILLTIFSNIAGDLAQRLRAANGEIRALEQ